MFITIQESLAASYEGIGMPEDAIQQYDELESSFQQVLKEKNMSWFGTFISPGPKDDSAPLLSQTKKPYRDLILANTISVFDLRIYLLSRQCQLLVHMENLPILCRKVSNFLGSFGLKLREVQVCSSSADDILTSI
jgi:trafficking protein particle complex subunit 10